ncbi:MAG TPA: hypothetical protein VMU01_03915 [Rhizomicrobium sp.]|nr:hypothetical protein [Rhizomicrobium sp.]
MRFGIIAVSLLTLAGVAYAATDDEIMDTRYGNTTLVHETLGTSHIYYKQDHTFTGGNWILDVSGKWKIENGQICLYYDKTPPMHPNPECDKIEHHNIGDKWTLGSRNFELVKGIVK